MLVLSGCLSPWTKPVRTGNAGKKTRVVRPRTVRALESAVEELRATIADLRQRLDRERDRVDELHTALADAVTAERIAAGEAAALRAIVTGLRARPWWRRWFR